MPPQTRPSQATAPQPPRRALGLPEGKAASSPRTPQRCACARAEARKLLAPPAGHWRPSGTLRVSSRRTCAPSWPGCKAIQCTNASASPLMKLVMPSSHACFPAWHVPHSMEPQPEEQERHQSFRSLEVKTYSLPGRDAHFHHCILCWVVNVLRYTVRQL